MAQPPWFPAGPDAAGASPPLIARVAARVSGARLVIDGRPSADADPGAAPAFDRLAASVTRTPVQVQEARSLRRVFRDLGDRYDQYRARTGSPESPAVRDAASCFRRELSFAALVAYAERLEELDIPV